MSSFTTLFIDLDQTIYPANSGIWEDVADRIHAFLQRELELTAQEAIDLRARYYKNYGTTLRGLQQEKAVDPIDYMEFIHDVPIEQKIQVDPDLHALLSAIKIPKYIFTNASITHAERVLKHLGVDNCFDEIIDIIRLDYACKPDPLAYQRAFDIVGNPDPAGCILIDDSLINLQAGARIGITTVHVGSDDSAEFLPDYQIATIHALFEVLPELNNSHDHTETSDG
jgi:putative hydrolase of the HAD superfamily